VGVRPTSGTSVCLDVCVDAATGSPIATEDAAISAVGATSKRMWCVALVEALQQRVSAREHAQGRQAVRAAGWVGSPAVPLEDANETLGSGDLAQAAQDHIDRERWTSRTRLAQQSSKTSTR
jgi:hypothetical protein